MHSNGPGFAGGAGGRRPVAARTSSPGPRPSTRSSAGSAGPPRESPSRLEVSLAPKWKLLLFGKKANSQMETRFRFLPLRPGELPGPPAKGNAFLFDGCIWLSRAFRAFPFKFDAYLAGSLPEDPASCVPRPWGPGPLLPLRFIFNLYSIWLLLLAQ